MNILPIQTDLFLENQDLGSFIVSNIPKLTNGSILAVTSKIVALSQGRTVVVESFQTKGDIVRKESQIAIHTKYAWLTVKDGVIMASAGIDESNADGKLILLPNESFVKSRELCDFLRDHYKIQDLGVLITDSRTFPFRAGVMGVAIGYAGFRGIRDYRGTPDIFGRKFKFSKTNIADSLAATAVLVMGEGSERKPLVVMEGAPVDFCLGVEQDELKIEIENDMYMPLFVALSRRSKKGG